MRADIAKWAIANGNWPAANKRDISESTIRGFIKSYKKGQFVKTTLNLCRVKNVVAVSYYLRKDY